jgi:hypothetical protein
MRFRRDVMTPVLVPGDDHSALAAFDRLLAQLLADPAHQRQLPERCVLIFDNQRFLHARSEIRDPTRLYTRIRFDLRAPPPLYPVLQSVGMTQLTQCPVVTSVPAPPPAATAPPLYWSPSGQSGIFKPARGVADHVYATVAADNDRQRKLFAQAVARSGVLQGTRCLNLFSGGQLYRSSEIIGELLRRCHATNLPVGPHCSLADLELLMRPPFLADAIGGFSSKLIALASAAAAGAVDLRAVRCIIFAGEPLAAEHRQLLRQVCHPDLQFLGLYGSAQTGVFAFQTAATIRRAGGALDAYQAVDDIAAIEFLIEEEEAGGGGGGGADPPASGYRAADSSQEVGCLVVSNFIRRPYLLRYNTMDLASPVCDAAGTRCADLFLLRGRHPRTRALPLGNSWLTADDIVRGVLSPCGLADQLYQLTITSPRRSSSHYAALQLLIQRPASTATSTEGASESLILEHLTALVLQECELGPDLIELSVVLAEQPQFSCSPISSKHVIFVDRRN